MRSLIFAGLAAGAFALPAAAEAAAAFAAGSVNLRAGPAVTYARVATIPAGARLEVFGCSSWCEVRYRGIEGYVSANYITSGYAEEPAPMDPPRYAMDRPPPPTWGYDQEPWWDDQYHSWYDGRRWYRDHRWYDTAPGVGFYFGFGG